MNTPYLVQYNHSIRTALQISIIPVNIATASALAAAMNATTHNWATLAVVDRERDGIALRTHFDNEFQNHPGKPFTLPKRCPPLRNAYLIQYDHTSRTPNMSIITAQRACVTTRLKAGALLPYTYATVAVLNTEEDAYNIRELIHAAIDLYRRRH